MRITILYIGKPRSAEANALAAEYVKRANRYCTAEMREVRDETALSTYPKALKAVLDPRGKQKTSEEFAHFIEQAGRDIVFFVGGADGFSGPTRESADVVLSLGKPTLPHELARAILAEQIYRAFAILNNHPYAR